MASGTFELREDVRSGPRRTLSLLRDLEEQGWCRQTLYLRPGLDGLSSGGLSAAAVSDPAPARRAPAQAGRRGHGAGAVPGMGPGPGDCPATSANGRLGPRRRGPVPVGPNARLGPTGRCGAAAPRQVRCGRAPRRPADRLEDRLPLRQEPAPGWGLISAPLRPEPREAHPRVVRQGVRGDARRLLRGPVATRITYSWEARLTPSAPSSGAVPISPRWSRRPWRAAWLSIAPAKRRWTRSPTKCGRAASSPTDQDARFRRHSAALARMRREGLADDRPPRQEPVPQSRNASGDEDQESAVGLGVSNPTRSPLNQGPGGVGRLP